MKLNIIYWDITYQNSDVVVNSANPSLLWWWWIDWLIHLRAWEELYQECLKLRVTKELKQWLEPWNAVITWWYKLKAKHIIHTHWPVCREYTDDSWKLVLENCYINCLEITDEENLKSISFPLIWNGIFCCKVEETSIVALKTIKEYFENNKSWIEEVRIVVYSDEEFRKKDEKSYEIYMKAYNEIYLKN